MADKLGVLAKCLAVLTTLFFVVACDSEVKPHTPSPKVLESIKGSIEKSVDDLVIVGITDDGLVYLGKPGQSIKDVALAYRLMRLTPHRLEGKATIGDKVVTVLYYEDQLLANGAVRRVIVGKGVRSVNNQALEKYFNGLKGE